MPNSQLPPIHRYLWAQGVVGAPLPVGSLLAQRYQVIRYPLLLDTQPQAPPRPVDEVPVAAIPYLALSPFSIAIPRPFTQVMHPDGQTPLLLLEEVPLQGQPHSDAAPTLLPSLKETWPQASAIEQLTWLWRLAKLWQPCLDQQVAHCLLDDQLVRVDGEDVRLLQLEVDQATPALVDLGRYWQPLVATAAPAIRDYLAHLTEQLVSGQGRTKGLIYSLVQALEQQSLQQTLQVQLAAYSDQGPMRSRNEDACFPPSGTVQSLLLPAAPNQDRTPPPLLLVCDGVGGHQGGDVASHSAIAAVTQQLEALLASDRTAHGEIVSALKQAMLMANQVIAERNDADQRRERGRMGTTIVMALVYGGRLYVAHLGDSRAYRVRSHNCRQLTLDDDVAAREMRLGLGLYQDALQNPGSGALVQALGMGQANYLHPTVKLFSIAADSLILLCSDGLSDHDLVDQLWATELLPVLAGDRDVDFAARRLVDLANIHNGHDNVTVELLRLSPQPTTAIVPVPLEIADTLVKELPASATTTSVPVTTAPPAGRSASPIPTKSRRGLPLVLTSVLIAGLVGIASAIGWQWWQRRSAVVSPVEPEAIEGEILSPSAAPPTAQIQSVGSLAVGDYLQIQQLPDPSAAATLITTTSPPEAAPPAAVDLPKRLLSVGSVVQVSSRQQTPDGQLWVRLEVCSAATPNPEFAPEASTTAPAEPDNAAVGLPLPLALPGDQGWLLQSDLPTFADRLLDTSSTQQGLCTD